MSARREVLFIQGGGAGTHDEWDHKLVDSLRSGLGPSYEIRYPRMPAEDDPGHTVWKPAIEMEIAKLDDGAVLIGHSVGGTILINALAERKPDRTLSAIFLIAAPFVGEGGWPSEDLVPPRDLGEHLPAGVPIQIFHGLADEAVPPSHADLYAKAVPQACIHRLPGRDHQLNDDLSEVSAAIRSHLATHPHPHPR